MPRNNRPQAAGRDAVYRMADRIRLTENEAGIVTLSEPQDHKIQQVFRKLRFRIPEYRHWTLDAYGSFIVKQLARETALSEIARAVQEKFGPDAQPLYERLLPYLQMLEGRRLIQRTDR